MTVKHTSEPPSEIWIARWTDVLGVKRRAICTHPKDYDMIRTVDPNVEWVKGRIDWTKETA